MIELDEHYLYEVDEGAVVIKFHPKLSDKRIIVTLESGLPEELSPSNAFCSGRIVRVSHTVTHFKLKSDGSIDIDDFIVPVSLRKKGLGEFILKKAISAFNVSPTTSFSGMLSIVDIPKKSTQFWLKVLDTDEGRLEPATEDKDGFFLAPLKDFNQ
ncbi:hypothetical protein [Aliiglaciecola lipolytica]|uniref:Uncharacterized protein n=1 Tax=Aliiglaciecola lipolytica E3 TaxID=1127673 RepID=K6WXM6_9ALTE|nr:hypothetical protein [Aliiglaciecola lipolytica]GAC13229.1 hypothetical protein GLIP_0583 [Aliiglaciecola lipolytica E3]